MTKHRLLFFLIIVLSLLVALGCAKKNQGGELSVDEAIKFAAEEASRKKYDTSQKDIEILKVKKGMERGPIRLATLLQTFGPDMATVVATREYWVIYFYPRGTGILGGDFTALVDLHSGEIITSKLGM